MDISQLRKDIDHIDNQIFSLLNSRINLVEQVADVKKQANTHVLQTDREQEILKRIAGNYAHDEEIDGLYRYLFEISRMKQTTRIGKHFDVAHTHLDGKITDRSNTVVTCQGTLGAFSALAKDRCFSRAQTKYVASFEDVLNSVTSASCDYGVLPTHNSNAGSVLQVYDLMAVHPVYIVDSVTLAVDHHLVCNSQNTALCNIKKVYSHPQALQQCENFLKTNLSHAEIHVSENTALAAEFVANQPDHSIAAICSEACAHAFSLHILNSHIQDNQHNYTHFVVVANRPNLSAKNSKISLIVKLSHHPGSLYQLLTKFSLLHFNLTKLESRPIAGSNFEYLFYLDFDGNALNDNVACLLAQLQQELDFFQYLGNY